SSAGDIDLIHTSCDLGLGFGNFPQLVMRHLIPARRVTPAYIIDLLRSISTSTALLHYYRSGVLPQEPSRLRTTAHYLLTWLTQDRHRALTYKTSREGAGLAARIARSLPPAKPDAAPSPSAAAGEPPASELPARRQSRSSGAEKLAS